MITNWYRTVQNRKASGRVVRYYKPPLRSWSFILTTIIGGTAALGWYWMKVLEGRWLIVPVGLLTVGVTHFAFRFFNLFILPGKRVVIYENGIRIGKKFSSWKDIQKIEYHHTFNKDGPYGVHHKWDIVCSGGRRFCFHAYDDGMGFYIDVPELETFLQKNVGFYENLHAPKVRAETGCREDTGAKRILHLPALWDELNQNLARSTQWTEVFHVLKQGEVRRRRCIRVNRARVVLARLTRDIIRFLIRILAFTVIYAVGVILLLVFEHLFSSSKETSYVLDIISIPRGFWRYIFFAAIGVVSLLGASYLEDVMHKLHTKSHKYEAIAVQLGRVETAQGADKLAGQITSKEGIGLYLRNFGEEYFRFIDERPDLEEEPLVEPMARDFDTRLVDTITSRIPLFALANVMDPTPSVSLIQLFVSDDKWTMVADELIRIARFIVLVLGAGSPGLLRELMVVDALNANDKTLVILGAAIDEEALGDELKELLSRFPHYVREGLPEIETALSDMFSCE